MKLPQGAYLCLLQIYTGCAVADAFLIGDRDRDLECNVHCSNSQVKPLCVSDGRTYESRCDYLRAKCRDSTLEITHRGRCKAQEQAKKPQDPVFIPECNEDGSFSQVQCHTFTGYCWCVTPDGKPVSGSSVKNQRPVCSGTSQCKHSPSLIFHVLSFFNFFISF
uniref:SPARC related modular calcium binding 1 n=1 Tax=Callorhinchus milii TaxID=7868 RepID=A0A4W3KF29_CALMI